MESPESSVMHAETKNMVTKYVVRHVQGGDIQKFLAGLLEILEAEARRVREVEMRCYVEGQRVGRQFLIESLLKDCSKN